MIAGLEFIRSWRFWVVLVASTSAITLGSAGAYIASVLYLTPMLDGSPDPMFPWFIGFLLLTLFTGITWYIFGRDGQYLLYPKAYEIRLALAVAFSAAVLVGLEGLAIRRLFVDPMLDGAANSNFTMVFGFVFGISGGQWLAKREWAAMTGAKRETGQAEAEEAGT